MSTDPRDHVFRLLRKNNIGEKLSGAIASLVTYEGHVPQGALTSPNISNAFLYDFDKSLTKISEETGLDYSRYADDITISGESCSNIEAVIKRCVALLADYGLKLKDSKTRIASTRASQRVTGLVVNEKIQPPREYHRKVRAIFHNANQTPERFIERIDELRGHISYLSSFDVLKDARHLRRYRMVIKKLVAVANKK